MPFGIRLPGPVDIYRLSIFGLIAGAVLAQAGAAETAPDAEPSTAINALLEESVTAWNRGDLEGFMATYWKSPELRFASENTVHRGWQATLDRYRRRYGADRQSMGRLAFSDIEITRLATGSAVVFGRYHLVRAEGRSTGLFTLTVRKMDDGWRIVQDHTSTGQKP